MGNIIKIAISIGIVSFLYIIIDLLFEKIILKRLNNINIKFLKSICQVLVVIMGITLLMFQFTETRDLSSKLMQGGTLIIAIITFAAQKTLGNIISGFSIAIAKPFDIGQKVKVVNGGSIIAEGYIKDITVRHTIIEQYDGQSCIIPNSTMDESVVINTNYEGDVGNYLEIEIGYNSDIKVARKIFKNIIKTEPKCINKDNINIMVSRFTANGLVLKTTIWTKTLNDNFIVSSIIRERLVTEFNKAGIVIPYQTITIDGLE